MNRLLELWSEFRPKISVIYQTYVDTLWTKVGVPALVILILINLGLIPFWLQCIFLIILTTIMVWSLFGLGKKLSNEPAKRQISITTSSGDEPTVNNFLDSKSSTKGVNGTVSGSAVSRTDYSDVDDTELDTNSTSSMAERLQKQSISSREPLDQITWSAVTSPGFTTRILQHKKGNYGNGNPLRESNSPNMKSPIGSALSLGQRPAPWKAESKLNPPSFQSPVNTGRYSVTRKKKQVPFGTTFVHVAPVDVINQALVKNSPGQGMNGLGSTGLDRSGGWNGMGGYHPASPGPPPPNVRIQQKLWQPPVMGEVAVPYEGIGRPNVLGGQHPMNQQLMSSGDHGGNRKRVRLPDGLMDGRPGPTRSPVPNYVHHDEITKQNSKRTKYIQSTEMRYPNVMVSSTHRHSPYVNALPTCDDETMTSESILEQMNKTEKRFLPDDDTIARMRSPKKARSNSSPKGPGNMLPGSPSSYRKRRQVMTTLEDEDEIEKNRGFCSCSECYEEAAGMNESRSRSAERSLQLNSSISSSKKKKIVSFCNSTMDEKGYISALAKKGKANDATEKFSPVPLQVITKERHEADKKRRLERLNRMLNESFKRSEYKPETSVIQSPPSNVNNTTISGLTSGGIKPTVLFGSSKSSEDVVDNVTKAPTTTSSSVSATTSAPFSFGASSTTTTEAKEAVKTADTTSSGFSFGVSSTSATSDSAKPAENNTSTEPSKTSASGFSFGAPASTTAASSVPSVTSPATFAFGAGSTAPSSEPSAASAGSFSFGASTTTSQVASPAATAATSSSIFGSGGAGTSVTPAGQTTSAVLPTSTFSFGSNVAAPTPSTTSAPDVPKTAGGFSFGQGTTTFGAASDAPKAAAAATTASSGFSFGAPPAASPVPSPAPSTQSMTFLSSATTTTASSLFGQSATSVPSMFGKDSASPVQSGSIFGATATVAPAVASTPSSSTSAGAPIPASTAAPAFSFGAAGAAAATSAPAPATTSGGLFAFGQKKDSAPSPFGGQKTEAATTFGQPTTQASSSSSIFGQQQAGSTGGMFGQATPTTTAPASSSLFSFGKPNVDAVKTAFGAPSTAPAPAPAPTFGATATTTAGGFGQASGGFSFGSTATTPKFGQTSTTAAAAAPPAFGQAAPGTPSFGQPSSKSATPTFGHTAAATPSFGQTPSTAPPPYGQGTTSTFGQAGSSSTPAFGQSTSTTFGQSTTGSTPAFGQSSTGTTPAFGQSNAQSPTPAFGQSSAATAPSSSTFGGSASSPFGQQPQATSPFGGSATSGGNVFGSAPGGSSTFGQSSKTTSAFGAATTTPSFGASGSTSFGGGAAGGASSPFGQQSPAASPFGGGGATSPPAFGQTTTQANTTFGGGNASAFGQAAASPSSGFSFGGGTPAGANTSFGAPANKPFGQQSSNTSGAFSFGSNQPSNNSFSFGGGSNTNAPAPAFGGSGGGGFGGAAQPASNVSFGGATAAANPAQAAPAPGVFQFGQQQPSQGGFNFAAQAQASPQFGGAPQQQQQQPMFSIGSSSARRIRDPRTRRYNR